jgi:hypothetical protein
MNFNGFDDNLTTTTTTSIPLEPIISLNCRQNDTFRFIKGLFNFKYLKKNNNNNNN